MKNNKSKMNLFFCRKTRTDLRDHEETLRRRLMTNVYKRFRRTSYKKFHGVSRRSVVKF